MPFSLKDFHKGVKDLDPDISEMALRDLYEEIDRGSLCPSSSDKTALCTALLNCLSKRSQLALQGWAIKNLSALSPLLAQDELQQIAESLMGCICQVKKEELRDVSGMGLRSVIQLLSSNETATAIINQLLPKLLDGIQGDVQEVKLECLGVVGVLIRKYARTLLVESHGKLQDAIMPELAAGSSATRKQAVSCLGALSVATSEEQFSALTSELARNIRSPSRPALVPTYIAALAALSKSVGYRLDPFVAKEDVVNHFIELLADADEDEDEGDKDDLRVVVFNALGVLVRLCPGATEHRVDEIVARGLAFVAYDPAWFGEDDEDDEEWSDEEDDEDGEDWDDDVEQDGSWKVRKAAIECLRAVVTTRPDLLGHVVLPTIVPAIVARVSERDDSVRQDVLSLVLVVLEQSIRVADPSITARVLETLPHAVPRLIKALGAKGSAPHACRVFSAVVHLEYGALATHLDHLIPALVDKAAAQSDEEESALIGVYHVLCDVCSHHDADVVLPFASSLCDALCLGIQHPQYKVCLGALRALLPVVRRILPGGDAPHVHAEAVYAAVYPAFSRETGDAEVKAAAMRVLGAVAGGPVGAQLGAERVESVTSVLVARTTNKFAAEAAFETLQAMASSDVLGDQLVCAIDALLGCVGDRSTQRGALSTLGALLDGACVGAVGPDVLERILRGMAKATTPTELGLAPLTMGVASAAVARVPQDHRPVGAVVTGVVAPAVLRVAKGSGLPSSVVDALMRWYGALVAQRIPECSCSDVLDALVSSGRRALRSSASVRGSDTVIAQCVAAACLSGTAKERDSAVKKFISQVKKGKGDSERALLCLGEIGRRVDLAHHNKLASAVLDALRRDETSLPASYCLGNLTVGNVGAFLPSILDELASAPEHRARCLLCIREAITRLDTPERVAQFRPHLDAVLPPLLDAARGDVGGGVGVRDAVAGCLGRAMHVAPEHAIAPVIELLGSADAGARRTAALVVKAAASSGSLPPLVEDAVRGAMAKVAALLKDEDAEVRLAALQTLGYVAAHHPALVRPVAAQAQPGVVAAATYTNIEVVELGMVKHKIDHGEPLRKAAFECLGVLISGALDKLVLRDVIATLGPGLKDKYDVAVLAALLVVRVARAAGPVLVQAAESVLEPLGVLLGKKVSEGASPSEVTRHHDMLRAAMNATAALAHVPEAQGAPVVQEFLETRVKATPALQKAFEQAAKDA